MKKEELLIISYTFPPYAGIGGRRWAKFAKYLSRAGYTVHVIHAKSPFNETSLWDRDVENNPGIIRHELNSLYPKILLKQPKTTFGKVWYKLSLMFVKAHSKGTPYDKGVFWRKQLLNSSIQLIKKYQIKNIIVSCAPFSSSYQILELQKSIKNLNILIDFRDPWTWGNNYGFKSIEKSRMDYEVSMENEVIQNCSKIFVPVENMKNYLEQKYSNQKDKIFLLSHGFDEDEINIKPKIESNKIRILFYGTLYDNIDNVFEQINSCLKNSPSQYSLDIYSLSKRYINCFNQSLIENEVVKYFNAIEPLELFNKFDHYDYILIIQPNYAKNYISTKIFEIIYSRTPILLISEEGELSNLILKNKLGIHILPKNIISDFEKISQTKKTNFEMEQFSIKEYSYDKITRNLTSYFK